MVFYKKILDDLSALAKANIRNHKLNPQIYLCDVSRHIKKLSKDGKKEMVNLLAHKWQPGLLLVK